MKGIIVITDIPQNCAGCDYSHCIEGNFRCVINDRSVREHVSYQTKPKWCPIKAYDIDKIVEQLEDAIKPYNDKYLTGVYNSAIRNAIEIVKGGLHE